MAYRRFRNWAWRKRNFKRAPGGYLQPRVKRSFRSRISTYSAGKKVLLGMGLGVFVVALIASLVGVNLTGGKK